MSSKTIITQSDTLKILHLPPHLSDERRNRLLEKYGATQTKTLRLSDKYTITFAKFPTHKVAMEASLRLHQLNMQGHYLTVEFAKTSMAEVLSQQVHQDKISQDETKKDANGNNYTKFLKKLNSWTMNQVFTQPPPPHMKYKYRPPKPSTLLRIAIQLFKEPIFYTQVLHLMNRMSLPPPFEELELEFPVLKEAYDIEKYKNIFFRELNISEDEEESEIESDTENSLKLTEIIPLKRKRQQSTMRLKIPKFVNPAKHPAGVSSLSQKSVKPEEIFESVPMTADSKNLRIELRMTDKLLEPVVESENSSEILTNSGGFGLMFPIKPKEQPENSEQLKDSKNPEFMTSEELAANRVSENDQRLLSVFKNYHPGKPSTRLYIKNLAKQVEINDLHFIYRKYVIPNLGNAENEYDIRLMQEGRMKGQAFVTLQNVMQAQLALDETNGFILKDKPMVVQFAKTNKN